MLLFISVNELLVKEVILLNIGRIYYIKFGVIGMDFILKVFKCI